MSNPHQPISEGSHYRCAAPGCGYAIHQHRITRAATDEDHRAYWAGVWEDTHAAQYNPDRAPDITVDWEISACCSVCPDGIGDIETVDSETVACKECGTTWDMRGSNGHRQEQDQPHPRLVAGEDISAGAPLRIEDTCCGQCINGTCYVDQVTGA